jgi:DNA repair ATPase RecN
MGRPPPHIIFKKLATRIVKNMVPNSLNDLEIAKENEEMFLNEESNEGPNYKKWRHRVGELQALEKKYKNMMDSRKYLNQVMKHMAHPPRKVQRKGRFQFHYHHIDYKPYKLYGFDIDYDY